MTDRKKPGVTFWATVGLVVVLIYPLSMGPVWWLFHQIPISAPIRDGIDAFYDPVWDACWSGPEWSQQGMRSYLDWWTRDQPPIP
jgi:hypothetical protein